MPEKKEKKDKEVREAGEAAVSQETGEKEKSVKKSKKKKKVATKEKKRSVTKKKIRVGAKVVANGKYWYSSYGAKPFGTAKNLTTEVKRIVKGRKYPICIGHYGWVKESQLQVK